MEIEELKNYLCRRVLITLNDSQIFKGYFKKIDNESIILSNLQYSKDKAIPVKQIISIRVLSFWDKFQRKKSF